ncbi:MAG TPA: peptidoglycan DD-metalloendopeptidase family protein [Solirubrobacteraceae bacterium]|nr:peptidoglycan DD-metalloendopeptidase family protein [Solirubrobacteraceae bacterium]
MSAAPVIAALLLAVFAPPAAATWRPPVDGGLTRPFAVTTNPFEAGQHRGIDLRAAPGTPVRAPCAGRVVVADRVGTTGGVVTLRCGRWRVTHLPLATIAVHAGTPVARGARLGTVAAAGTPGKLGTGAAHAGLHLGVRREGERFGYVDPLRFLAPTPSAPLAPIGRAPRGRRDLPPARPRAAPPATSPHVAPLTSPVVTPVVAPLTSPVVAPLPSPVIAPLTSPLATSLDVAAHADPSRLAPWPAWLGLALVLIGAGAGIRRRGGIRTRTRRRVRGVVRLNE